MIDLDQEEIDPTCHHCGFYHYLRHVLRISSLAWWKIDLNENFYFKNIHQNIFDPFIKTNQEKVTPIKGAISIGQYLIKQLHLLIKGYPKEDLQFMALALRELATWKIILNKENIWASVQVRNVAHVFTNLLTTVDEEAFGDIGIVEETDFISIYVMTEEIEKIISNVFNSRIFSWNPTLEKIIKTRLENEHLSRFHEHFEVQELLKPEEITFADEKIINFLKQRNLDITEIKSKVSKESEKLFGFSFQDLLNFREQVITISNKNGQVFELSPIQDKISIKIVFVFKEQLKEVWNESLENILCFMAYRPSFKKGNTYDKLSDPYMDYKFIFEYDNMLAFGILDSSNSITMFENISTSDHFIEDIFNKKATKVFQMAQRDISYLMGMKIAEHFSKKQRFYVPMQQKGVPNVNIKTIVGNGIKKRIVNERNQDLGDIDALAVDITNKKILLMEIKYYKPSTNNLEMLKKDKKIFEDIEKIKARAEWFNNNIESVVKAWKLEAGEYTVNTLLITGRANFYGEQIEKETEGIQYYTYDGIMRF
ncbi:hypothetical protein FO518_33060 [Priestia megaterium]|nr:hypothetical protein [Priestia megaterium]